jgi:DNA anti-recombination protein RmuC
MSVESERPHTEDHPLTELDRIRDIIFGSQMQTYDGQFDHLVNQLSLLDRKLDEIRTELSQQLSDQQARAEETQRALSDRIGQAESDLNAQAHQLADELRSEFSQALEDLREDKASRLDVGDVLVEMGTRLKQQFAVADLIGKLDETGSSEPTD